MSVLRDEGEYLSSIAGFQECQQRVPENSSQSESEQEFSHGILHCARGEQKWQHGHRWRQHGGDGDGAQAPTLEGLVDLLQPPRCEPARECFLSAFASKPIRDETPYHRTGGRHRSVIKPQLFVTCGQEERQYVHAAGEWNDGTVEDPERNKAEATELVNPVPDASRHRGCCARDSQESEHFSFESSIIVTRE